MSTRLNSSKSRTTLAPLAPIWAFSSSTCCACIRPISRIVVPCSSDTDSILRVIPAVACKGRATRKSLNYRNFGIGGEPPFQRWLNPRRGTIGVSGGLCDLVYPTQLGELSQLPRAVPMSVSRADRSGRLEAVRLDSQLLDLRYKCLPGYAQLGSSTGRPPDDALRLSQCVLDHFSFMFDKVSNERTTRRNRVWRHHWRKPGVIYRKRLA